MKRLHLLAVLILASMAAGAQIYQPAILYGRDESRVNVIKTILIPTGCGTPAVYTGADSAKMKAGIYFDSCNHRAWYYDPKRKAWDSTHLGAVSTGGGSGGSGGGIGAVYAGWGITAVNDSTLKVDSSTLSTYYLRIKDSTIYLTPSDAAALYALSSRTITAGTGLTGGGDLSANRTINADTSVLATKLALVKARDSLQTNINLKADKSTTVSTSAATGLIGGGDLSTNRTHAIDTSIIATKKALANSRDSVQINLNAKADKTTTVSTGTGLTGGGDLSTNRTHSVDTSVIATKLALAKARDSVQTNVNLKADKSTTISAGTGIGSGLGDISSNRTVSVDTSVMLTKLAGVKMRDSVQTNVNAKLNITDTTGKWVSTTYKKTGTDSIFQNKGGTITFLYRVDSVSAGGGSPNTSVGSGFKVAINGTNNIKSITASQHIGLDSLISNQLNIFADTTKLATKLALVKARDSVQTNVNLKADKSTTISAGTGIGSGLGDISANRTVNVDTSVMLTKLAGVKMRDSVQANVNTKLNISDTTNKWITGAFRRNDSVFVNKGGTWLFAFKDSVGTSGGGSVLTDSTLAWVTRNGDSTAYRIVSNDTLKSDFAYIHGKTTFGDSVRSNKSAIFIGHSVVANVGVSNPWEGFAWKTADLFGLKLINKGIAGTTVRHHLAGDSCFLDRLYTIPNYSGAPIFIMYDINDANASYGFDTTGYKTDYGKCIDTLLINRGYPNNKVVLLSANYVDTSVTNNYDNIRHFVRASRTVAEQKNIAYVDLFYSMERAGGSYYLSDEDHPNYKGTSFISGKIAKDYTAVKQVGDVLVNGGINGQDTSRFVGAVRIGTVDTATVDGIDPALSVFGRTYLSSKVYFNTKYDFGANAWLNIQAQTNAPGIYIKDGNPYTSSIAAGTLQQSSFGSISTFHGKGITTDQTNGFNLIGSGGSSYFFLENDHSVFGNSNVGHADLDSTHKVKGGFHVTGGFRHSGVPTGIIDTTTYKPYGINSSGQTVRMSYWPGSGGGSGGMADPGSNGILARTALNTTVSRTITGTTGQVVVSNGDGVSANPIISIDTAKMATKLAVDKARDSVQVNVNTKAASSITLNAGTGIDAAGLGNLTANRTINVDTSKMLTKLAAVKLRDSVQVNVNLKADKAITFSSGVGISTGLGDLSANRTVNVDTSVMLTKLAAVKLRDSVQTNVNAKVSSVSGTTNRITSTGGTTPVIDISSSYVGQSSITTTGTITSGGLGTGSTLGGVTPSLGSDATGDLYYRNSGGVLTRLPVGTTAQTLHVVGGIPAWRDTSAAGGGGGITPSNTGAGYRLVIPNGGQVKTLVNIWGTYYDSTATTLGIGIDTSDGNLNVATQGDIDRAVAGLGSSGEANTISAVGGGLSLFAFKGGVDLKLRSLNTNHFDTASNLASLDTINGPMSSATGNGYMKSIDYKRSFTAQTISNPTGTWTFDVNAGGQADVSLTATGGRTLAFSNLRTGDICIFRFNNTSGATITLTLPSNSFLDGTSAATLTIPTGRSQISLSGYDGTNSFFSSSSGTFATASNNLSFFSATTTKQFTDVISTDTIGTISPVQYAVVASDFTLSAASGVQTAFPSSQDVWTMQGSTTYEVEGHYFMTTGTTTTKTTAIAFALAGGATVTTINLHVLGSNNTANTTQTAQGSLPMTQVASTVVTATATTAGVDIFFKGIIITNARGTWTPQINFSANPGGTNLMKAGSYIKFTKLGTSAQAQIGNVN